MATTRGFTGAVGDGEVSVTPRHTAEDKEGGELEGSPLDGVELVAERHRRLLGP